MTHQELDRVIETMQKHLDTKMDEVCENIKAACYRNVTCEIHGFEIFEKAYDCWGAEFKDQYGDTCFLHAETLPELIWEIYEELGWM